VAWGKRIYCQFTQDITNILIDVEILQNGFDPAGAIEIILGEPALITRMGGEGDKYAIIKGREVTMNILTRSTDDFSWLYTNNDRAFKMVIKHDSVIEWTGFVLPRQYQEAYSYEGEISITASDQLGLLADRPYQFGYPAVSPTGYQQVIIILANILSGTSTTKTGLDLLIYSAFNLFESNMDVSDDDKDPLNQVYVNQDRWINDDLTAASCKDVIEDLLRPLQCRVFQSAGVWWIQRIPDMADSSIDYRIYNRDGVQTGYLHFHPQVVIDANFVILDGSTLSYDNAWRQRNIEISYGLKKSLIPNFNLPDKAFSDDYTITGWTNTGEWGRIKALNQNILAAYTSGRTAWDDTKYIVMPEVTAVITQELSLSIDTGRSKYADIFAPTCRIYIVLTTISGDTYYDDSTGSWSSSPGTFISGINFPRVNNINELVTQSITIKSVPGNGVLTIKIFAPYRHIYATFDDYFYFGNIKLTGEFTTAIGDNYLDSQIFTDFLSDETNYQPDDFSIKFSDGLGDDSLLPYYNGFFKVGTICSTTWLKKSLIGVGTPLPLVNYTTGWGVIADSWYYQYYTANKIFEGIFRGMLGFHNTLVIDSIIYLLNDIEIDLRDNIVSGSLIEILPETFGSGGGTLELKSRGIENELISSGLVSQPGGDDWELQIKSGGDFEGTDGITYDPTNGRILKGTLPLIEYRVNTETVTPGTTTIVFGVGDPDPFIAGDDPAVPPFWAVGDDGIGFLVIPENITINGFDVTVSVVATFTYTAIVRR
jgi:hypothetical protein